jgi:hypothetical protein
MKESTVFGMSRARLVGRAITLGGTATVTAIVLAVATMMLGPTPLLWWLFVGSQR